MLLISHLSILDNFRPLNSVSSCGSWLGGAKLETLYFLVVHIRYGHWCKQKNRQKLAWKTNKAKTQKWLLKFKRLNDLGCEKLQNNDHGAACKKESIKMFLQNGGNNNDFCDFLSCSLANILTNLYPYVKNL